MLFTASRQESPAVVDAHDHGHQWIRADGIGLSAHYEDAPDRRAAALLRRCRMARIQGSSGGPPKS